MCDLLGHRVEVRSAPGAGSCFTLRLGPPRDALRPGTTPAAAPVLPLAANRRVLVIEDDHDTRTALERLLASWGSEVATAPGPATALALLRSGFRPDALIVDLRLADGASGIEAIEQVRQTCDTALPTVLVTGDANAETLADPRLAGVPVLVKPIRAARLRAFLAQAFAV
jgi:CheY-like chemotaxis protein